jgi:hypothetical protein
MARLHALVGDQLGEVDGDVEVVVGIETDHGPWVQALLAAGYSVFAVNLLQAARYRDRLGVSGPTATLRMRTCSLIWSVPTLISCERWPGTARELRRSRWWRGLIRR